MCDGILRRIRNTRRLGCVHLYYFRVDRLFVGEKAMKFTEPEPAYSDENLMGAGGFISLAVIVCLVIFIGKCAVYLMGINP